MNSHAPGNSRPAPPEVAPIFHNGVRYEQDMQSARHGGTQSGGYLVAVDPATGERLWMLKVYEVPVQAGAPFQPGRYFRSMRLNAAKEQLEIESEAGGKYVVDLEKRSSTWISGPDSLFQKELRKSVSPEIMSSGSRVGLPAVSPLTFEGKRYQQIMNGEREGLGQRTGLMAIIDLVTGKRVAVVRLYDYRRDVGLEGAAGDVFFRVFTIDADRREVVIENERGQRFSYGIDNGIVRTLGYET